MERRAYLYYRHNNYLQPPQQKYHYYNNHHHRHREKPTNTTTSRTNNSSITLDVLVAWYGNDGLTLKRSGMLHGYDDDFVTVTTITADLTTTTLYYSE